MAYAMYLRKSRIDEEAGIENTLSKHETMLRDMAANMGIHIDESHIYREIVSGESIDARPQMQRLLKAVEMGLYTGVLCVELERLSRGNGEDQARILRTFQFSGTKILTLNKVYDLAGDDEFDEEFFEFGLFMSRREYKTIKRTQGRERVDAMPRPTRVAHRAPNIRPIRSRCKNQRYSSRTPSVRRQTTNRQRLHPHTNRRNTAKPHIPRRTANQTKNKKPPNNRRGNKRNLHT